MRLEIWNEKPVDTSKRLALKFAQYAGNPGVQLVDAQTGEFAAWLLFTPTAHGKMTRDTIKNFLESKGYPTDFANWDDEGRIQ